jgi:hypothetical protein
MLLAGSLVTKCDPIATAPAPRLAESAIVMIVATILFFMVNSPLFKMFVICHFSGLLFALTCVYTRDWWGRAKRI